MRTSSSESPTGAQARFRTDIEGLRGVAILMVVLAHAGVPGFAGGFTGVDVFFVISGFLITGLLLRELQQSSGIVFWRFYARRVRRLLPAFAAMMLIVMVAVACLVPIADQKLQALSGMWAALWSSNIYFSIADFGYFDASSRDSVFLHTWSLGVEEQFYLIWPLLLACIWKVSGSRFARATGVTIAVIAVAGFALSLFATARWPVVAYYLMPFRLWELAVGGLCSLVVASRPGILGAVQRHAGIPGAALVLAACVIISERMPYPGAWALLPVVGTALLLVAGTVAPDQPISRLIGTPALTLVGRVSYSWYLWHWPVLVLMARMGHGDPWGKTIAVLGSFALALLTYRLVERTTRHRAIVDARQLVIVGLLASALLALVPSTWRALVRSNGNGMTSVEARIRSTISVPQIYSMPGCDEWYASDRLMPCTFSGGEGPRPTAVVIGDSLGLHWFPALRRVFADAGWNLEVLTKSSCPIADESFFYERIHRRYTECETWRDSAVAYVRRTRPALVIIGSAGSYPFTPEQWTAASRRTISQLREGSPHVLVLAPTPRLPFDGPGCAISHASALLQQGVSDACTAKLAEIEDHAVIESLQHATDGIDGATVLNLNNAICPAGVCSAWSDGLLVFRDFQHLNAGYALKLAPDVAAQLAPYMRDGRDSAQP